MINKLLYFQDGHRGESLGVPWEHHQLRQDYLLLRLRR